MKEIEIPEGYEARIEGNKVVIDLKDSEDEKMRKFLLNYFIFYKNHPDLYITPNKWQGVNTSDIIAYLERQKEQKPIETHEFSDAELERHQKELYDFKVFAARQAREHHISFVHDFEWNNFCEGLLFYFNEKQKPAEWSEEDEKYLNIAINIVASDFGENSPIVSFLKSLRPQPKRKQEEIVLHWESGHPEPYKPVLILRHGNVVVEGEWNEETGRWYQYGFQSYLEDNEVDGWMNKKSLLFGNFHPYWKSSEEQNEQS